MPFPVWIGRRQSQVASLPQWRGRLASQLGDQGIAKWLKWLCENRSEFSGG